MAVIHDIINKIRNWKPEKPLIIIAEDHADKLICSKCGKQYASRGKWDCGICRDCEKEMVNEEAHLIGGVYDGQKVGDSTDKG